MSLQLYFPTFAVQSMLEDTKIRFSVAQFPILADEIFKEILIKLKLKVFLWRKKEKFVIYFGRKKKQKNKLPSVFLAQPVWLCDSYTLHIIPMKTAEESVGKK